MTNWNRHEMGGNDVQPDDKGHGGLSLVSTDGGPGGCTGLPQLRRLHAARVQLIGGTQYVPLDAEIEKREELTGERLTFRPSLVNAHIFDAATGRAVGIG